MGNKDNGNRINVRAKDSLGSKRRGFTVVLLALIIVLALSASYGVMKLVESRAHSSAEKLVSDVVEHIDEKMNEVELATLGAADEAYEILDNPEALEQLVHDFVGENSFVYGSTIAFEPDYFPDRGRCFAPYSWAASDGKVHDRQLGTETDYYEEEWYAETKLRGEDYWCEPYFDEGGAKTMMCTFSVPLKDGGGKTVAVMTADVGLEDLEEYVATITPNDETYIVLRSQNGNVLVNEDLGSDEDSSNIIIKGRAEIGWSVELNMPFTYLMNGDANIFIIIGLIFLLTIIFGYIINRVILRMQRRSNAEYLNVIDAVSRNLSSIYLVDLLNNETVAFRDPPAYAEVLGNMESDTDDFISKLSTLIRYDCYEADRELMLREVSIGTILEKLSSQDRYEVRFRKVSDGRINWHEMQVYAMERDGGGAPVQAVIAFSDVNDSVQKETEARNTLEQALTMAESANNAKTEFLFNMSHDIRTPMNAILGYTDIALHHIGEQERVADSLSKIKTSGSHLLSLINDILEMSRIEAGKMELVKDMLDAYEVTDGINHMGQALAATKDITFKTVIGAMQNPYVYADELHTNQVVINLISNAIKYTPSGGTVEYRVEQTSEAVNGTANYRLTVKDNGIGMSEEFQQHLFESFSRENSATVSKQEGAGLGLAIVKRIVDLIGGTISVQSRKDEGSTFIVELPLEVMDDEAVRRFESEREESTELVESTMLEGRRVLLVEDNEMNREIAREILEDAGMIVETAEDGAIAVKLVGEKGVDYYEFILMDIQMPVMGGYEATAAIRNMPDGDRVTIIALSANAFREDVEKSLATGMNAHVAKPIDLKVLYGTMLGLIK